MINVVETYDTKGYTNMYIHQKRELVVRYASMKEIVGWVIIDKIYNTFSKEASEYDSVGWAILIRCKWMAACI